MVGPQKVAFGSCTVAGQVLRREVPSNRLVGDVPRKVDKEFYARVEAPGRILKLNLEYIGHLTALRVWYRDVRLARIPAGPKYEHIRIVTQAASELLSICINERAEKLRQFLEERGIPVPSLLFVNSPCPLKIEPSSPYLDHIEWVKGLSDVDVQSGVSWLQSIVESRHAEEEGRNVERRSSN